MAANKRDGHKKAQKAQETEAGIHVLYLDGYLKSAFVSFVPFCG